MKSPDEQVGEDILAIFKSEELLSDASISKIRAQLILGTLTAADWRLAFETDSTPKERPE
jgi:hypothetical protein